MTMRMLVDATHPEETRVVVVSGNKLEEFDFETAAKKQLKGNIYLAKVTRVEPSLQAAFVEYGGNRHGFLAFSEIHPDYYRIPIADREALIAEQAAARAAEDANGNGVEEVEPAAPLPADGSDGATDPAEPVDNAGEPILAEAPAEASGEAEPAAEPATNGSEAPEVVETLGGDDLEPAASPASAGVRNRRSYKIQEVIKRRQIMLVQVTKEERGNKGAALTTFLSLAGRYCVLMPNTPRGGGISRKIANPKDRKRMKAILDDLDLPDGMAVILRTAGLERTKAEIKRDLEYLLRLWDSIRELTLASTAPALINEEANLIKRAIRDLYAKEIEEIQVAGEEGYRTAKDFMRMLMPSHSKKVQVYRDPIPLFQRYQVESQIDAMHSPIVQLRSGGYIVISPTEALVAIDVNSGRATRERNIEETAYKTNMEAAEEVARQLRLRDLAGLIVVDFIDMEEERHNGAVERKLKEAMRLDRARIQLGRISPFGLLELSRQRLRPSLLETHFETCARCGGTGLIRSLGSTALHVLRAIEEEGIRRRAAEITVRVPVSVALYVLNQKRDAMHEIEVRYGFRVLVEGDDSLVPPAMQLERTRSREAGEALPPPIDTARLMAETDAALALDVPEDEAEEDEAEERAPIAAEEAADDQRGRRRRRPRRGRRRDERGAAEWREAPTAPAEAMRAEPAGEDEPGEPAAGLAADALDEDERARRRRRRGKRGGRRRVLRPDEAAPEAAEAAPLSDDVLSAEPAAPEPAVTAAAEPADTAEEPRPRRGRRAVRSGEETGEARGRRRSRRAVAEPAVEAPDLLLAAEPATVEPSLADAAPALESNGAGLLPAEAPPLEAPPRAEPALAIGGEAPPSADEPAAKPRRGWWQRLIEG